MSTVRASIAGVLIGCVLIRCVLFIGITIIEQCVQGLFKGRGADVRPQTPQKQPLHNKHALRQSAFMPWTHIFM